MVGVGGFEPPTSRFQGGLAARLRYTPMSFRQSFFLEYDLFDLWTPPFWRGSGFLTPFKASIVRSFRSFIHRSGMGTSTHDTTV